MSHLLFLFDEKEKIYERCPPCRRFTPILIDFYEKYSKEKNFEIIFISSDEDEDSFNQYYKDMPWLKLNQNDQQNKDKLDELFQINSIPTLILVDPNSAQIICKDARKFIQNDDKTGEHFPWKQQHQEDE